MESTPHTWSPAQDREQVYCRETQESRVRKLSPTSSMYQAEDIQAVSCHGTNLSRYQDQEFHKEPTATDPFFRNSSYREPAIEMKHLGFKQLDLSEFDGAKVKVLKDGHPGQFYCHAAREDISSQMEKLEK